MARFCELMGRKPQRGNTVSHSNRKTKRRYAINLQNITLCINGNKRTIRVSARAIKTLDKCGGIEAYMRDVNPAILSPKALRIRKLLEKIGSK